MTSKNPRIVEIEKKKKEPLKEFYDLILFGCNKSLKLEIVEINGMKRRKKKERKI